MNPISSLQAKSYIAEMLRREIFLGNIKPGEELTQEMLAEKLEVSRMPVREVLHQLELEGIVERLSNRHMRAVEINAERIADIFSSLEALELEAIIKILERKLDISKIEEAYEAIKKSQELNLELERAYHRAIVKSLDNPIISAVQKNLLKYFVLSLEKSKRSKASHDIEALHKSILQADSDKIKSNLNSYFKNTLQSALEE